MSNFEHIVARVSKRSTLSGVRSRGSANNFAALLINGVLCTCEHAMKSFGQIATIVFFAIPTAIR